MKAYRVDEEGYYLETLPSYEIPIEGMPADVVLEECDTSWLRKPKWDLQLSKWVDMNPPTFDELKEDKRKDVSSWFDKEIAQGKVNSSLGFPVDARRSSEKNDLQNMRELLTFMQDYGVETVTVVGADNLSHEGITQAQIAVLAGEIRDFGFALYEQKRQKIANIDNAPSKEELDLIVI